jgi:hypothetical protein
MNAWDHLPNAQYIDWVIDSVKQHSKEWSFLSGNYELISSHIMRQSFLAAFNRSTRLGRRDVRSLCFATLAKNIAPESRDWDCRLVRGNPYVIEHTAKWAVIALIAYDDCGQYLDMTSEQLKTWALLSEQPQAMLLVPTVEIREHIRELNAA